jgi:hypothetical protein
MVRLTEFDGDRCAARLSGSKSYSLAVHFARIIDYTWEGLLADLGMLHREQKLPDSLPQMLAMRLKDMTPELCTTLIETVVKPPEIPFDSRPSDAERLEAVKDEPQVGVLTCPYPATVLLADYPGLSREMTWHYLAVKFGAQLSKASLRRVDWSVGSGK